MQVIVSKCILLMTTQEYVTFVTLTTSLRNHLIWAQYPYKWTQQKWGTILFTDEIRFCLQTYSRKLLIWRIIGTRYQDNIKRELHTYGGWFDWNCCFQPHWSSQFPSWAAEWYQVDILTLSVSTLIADIDPDSEFIHDNSRDHKIRFVKEYLESETRGHK